MLSKNMKNTSFIAIIFAFAACIFICFSPSSQANDSLTPDATVSEFYKWYVHSALGEGYPLRDNRKKLSTFVLKVLIKDIEKGAGEDADYFTKSQDFFDDWETSILVKKSTINGREATVDVVLGATKESYNQLTVTLEKEGRLWKIRRVRSPKFPAPVHFPNS
jgi:hypothetical protein